MSKSPLNFVCICTKWKALLVTWQDASKYWTVHYIKNVEDFHLHIFGVYPTLALASGKDCPLSTVIDDLKADLACHCIVSVS